MSGHLGHPQLTDLASQSTAATDISAEEVAERQRWSDACTLVLRTMAISRGAVPRMAMELQLVSEPVLHRGECGGAKGLLQRALQQLVGDRLLELGRQPGRRVMLVPKLAPHYVAAFDAETQRHLQSWGR